VAAPSAAITLLTSSSASPGATAVSRLPATKTTKLASNTRLVGHLLAKLAKNGVVTA
jgi:hypothetical protein